MTQYKVELVGEQTNVKELKAETVGLAVLAAIGQGPKPKSVRVWAMLRDKGKDTWVQCHVAPSFLEAMIHLV